MLDGKTLSAFFVLAVALAVAIVKNWDTTIPDLSSLNIKRDIKVFVEDTSRLPPLTYRTDSASVAFDASYSHLASRSWTDASKEPPDTTAVVLNWSRFPNVQRIASLLCSPDLDHVIKEVFIWNNNPTPIFYSVWYFTIMTSDSRDGLSNNVISPGLPQYDVLRNQTTNIQLSREHLLLRSFPGL